jgi:hypothetical protein
VAEDLYPKPTRALAEKRRQLAAEVEAGCRLRRLSSAGMDSWRRIQDRLRPWRDGVMVAIVAELRSRHFVFVGRDTALE